MTLLLHVHIRQKKNPMGQIHEQNVCRDNFVAKLIIKLLINMLLMPKNESYSAKINFYLINRLFASN